MSEEHEAGRQAAINFLVSLIPEFYMLGRLNDGGIAHMLNLMNIVSAPADPVDFWSRSFPELIPWDNLRVDAGRLELGAPEPSK